MWQLLRMNRLYRRFYLAFAISEVGTRLHNLALVVYVYNLTGSAFALGKVLAVASSASLMVGPISGVISDRLDRRAIIWITNLAMALIAALFPLAKNALWIYILAFALTGLDRLFDSAWKAVFPSLVRSEQLLTANSLDAITQRGLQIIAPSIGGLLIARFGLRSAFWLNALSFAIPSLVALLTPVPDARMQRNREGSSFWQQFVEGLRLIFTSRFFIVVLVAQMLTLFSVGVNNALIFPFVSEVLKMGAVEMGYLLSAIAVGLLTGSYLLWLLRRWFSLKTLVMVGAGLMGSSMVLFSQTRWLGLALVVRVLFGLAYALFFVPANTLLQQHTPVYARGRIFSTFGTATEVTLLVGITLASFVAGYAGTPLTMALSGVVTLLALIPTFLLRLPTSAP